MKHCPNLNCKEYLQSSIVSSDKFCRNCGKILLENNKCICGHSWSKFDSFCPDCGKKREIKITPCSIFECSICEKEVLVEDLYNCDRCGKAVCPDCIVNNTLSPDDPKGICKDCSDKEHMPEEDR